MRRLAIVSLVSAALWLGAAPRAFAFDPYIGQLIAVGFNFCPVGWVAADGSLLPIADYDALFSIVGTTYGGDGQTTFAVPDLRGRVPIHRGQGAGLSPYALGQQGGAEQVTLTTAQLPRHTHARAASTLEANTTSPAGALPARKTRTPLFIGMAAPDTIGDASAVATAGGDQPHDNLPPYTVIHWCMAWTGIYPPQN